MAERIEGLSIGLDLDSLRLERGLTGLKDKLRTVNSEMKSNMSAFDRGDKSVEKYETRLSGLNKKLEVQKTVVKEAKNEYEKMVSEYGAGSKQAEKAAREYNNQAASLNNLERYIERTTDELEQFRKEQALAESKLIQFGDKAINVGDKLISVGDGMKNVGKNMMMYVTAPLMGFGALATKTGMDFDDSMARVQAISGSTGDDLLQLRDKAKEMGATTRFSASESAAALEYMALAGWKTEDMLGGIEGVMSLAAASGEDLATVSDIVTDALSAFGLSAEDSGRFADVLAAASANANTNVNGLGNAFKYVAPVAGALGYSVEDTATAIGLMSNAGIKGEKAGTALRTMFTNMASPTKQMKAAMDKLGLSITDSEGNMKSLDTIMGDLRGAFSGLDADQQAAYAATIFGKEAMSGSLAIINASEKDYKKLSGAIQDSNGAAKEMSDIMEGTLGGMWREIKSGLEGFMISVYETMLPGLEAGAEKLKGFVQWLNDLSPTAKMTGVIIGALAAALGPLLLGFGTLIIFTGKVSKGLGSVFKWVGKHKTLAKFGKVAGEGAKKVGLLSRFIGLLTGPVGWIITGITALGAAFVVAYKKSDRFRGIVNGVKDAFVNAYEKVKEFLTTNQSFLGFIDSLKKGFEKAKSAVMDGLGVALGFAKDKIADLKKFWDTEGKQLLQAFDNIFNGVWGVVEPVINWIVDAVKWAFPYVQKIIDSTLKVAFSIVKMIWGNIKGVIDGALDVIMGLIKTFSGLFTGDWSKMWEGIKQVTSGLVKFIWNFIQLSFFGKLIKGGLAFIKSFAGFFSSMWTGIKDVFSRVIKWIVEFVKNRFTSMQNTVSNITTGIREFLTKIWDFIWNGIFKKVIRAIVDFVKNRFSTMRENVSNIFTAIRDTASKLWNAVKDKIWTPVKNIVRDVKDRFNNLKTNVSDIFSNMRDNVSDWIGKMVQAVKDMPGKMADGVRKTAGKVKDAFSSIGNTMLRVLGKGVNGVISGINWVLDKLGIKGKIKEWPIPNVGGGSGVRGAAASVAGYAHGTDGHPEDGPAWVGDGTGRNSGPELIKEPGKKPYLSPAKPTLMHLSKGTQVLSALDTKEFLKLPAYANGIGRKIKDFTGGMWGGVKDFAKDTVSGIKNAKDVAFDVWDYVENPSKLLNKALEFLGIAPGKLIGALKDVPKAGFNKVKDGGIKFLKKKIDNFLGDSSAAASITGSASAWRPMIYKAAARMGESVTASEVAGIIAQIQRESGGNQRIVQSSAVWDVNTAAGNPARGLLQYIPQTFNAYKMPGHGNIYNGYDQLLAFFNNRTWRRDLPYGKRGWGPRGGRKFATGGKILKNGLYQLAEGGYPEWVIPTDPSRRTEAMKLLALAGKEISGNKRPHQLPNPGGGDNNYLEKMVSLLSEQVEETKEIVMLLVQLLAKDADVHIDGKTAGKLLEPFISAIQARKQNRQRRRP